MIDDLADDWTDEQIMAYAAWVDAWLIKCDGWWPPGITRFDDETPRA